MEVAIVQAVLESRYGRIQRRDEYGNSRIWRQMTSGRKVEVFIEAEVSNGVCGVY